MKTKILCIYLPQFHEIPENNEWWGEGFTEWNNVKRGNSIYPNHYQPRIPFNNEYYDLSDAKVLERHAIMAKMAGIFGFCFYHYYFNGKKLLEKPVEKYRNSAIDLPYCFIWANQSFERTWYRNDNRNEVLLKQSYGRQPEWKDHFEYLCKFFEDSRYIKIENRPVFIIYLPQDIYCRKEMFYFWNHLAKKKGYDGIYLMAMITGFGKDYFDFYDGYFYFEPMHSIVSDMSYRKIISKWKREHSSKVNMNKKTIFNYIFSDNIYSYRYLCKTIEYKNNSTNDKKIFPGVFSGWDNTPRKDQGGIIVRNSSPFLFMEHLRKIMQIAETKNSKFIFINSWNEWSEGAYIEPDNKYGFQYLEAIKKVTCLDDRFKEGLKDECFFVGGR